MFKLKISTWLGIVIGVFSVYGNASSQLKEGPSCNIESNWRIDCYPETVPAVQEHCESRGCCYQARLDANDDVPWCFYPSDYPTYQLIHYNETSYGYTGVLTINSSDHHPFGPVITKLSLDIFVETNDRLRFRLRDMQRDRYEVNIHTPSTSSKAATSLYDLQVMSDRFGVVVSRKSTGTVIFNSTIAPLIYADQFLQISTSLPSKYIYGLGERHANALVGTDWQRNAYWPRDQPPRAGANLYGDHPIYVGIEDDGNSHGVFFLNSNAKEVATQPAPALTWRSIGGIMDFYIFLGPTPESVVQQYTAVVGNPFLPPTWSLGFHLCRWGYRTANNTLEMVEKMRAAFMPQDVQWNDIDYMKSHLDFTYDHSAFDELPSVVDNLHQHGQHYVMIIDPGISNQQSQGSYPPYDDGISDKIFIKKSADGDPIVGKVWPGNTVFPDFTNPNAQPYWEKELAAYHSLVPFDGVWIDMNEPSNFLDGSTSGCPSNQWENPPYLPRLTGGSISAMTLCASAVHYNNELHYNVHSLTGLTEMIATSNALKKIRGKRPFVISRSTFPSAGLYGGHWSGDVRSTWADLKQSIVSVINFNLFGIPMIGADICGFGGDTSEELCIRWMEVGAFYPFSRNHNNLDSTAQAPVDFPKDAQTCMRNALMKRYSLLPYLYSLFFNSHVNGGTVARGLFSQFPKDVTARIVDEQFMWGSGLLISPVLQEKAVNVSAYFPAGLWYSFDTGEKLESGGKWVTLDAPICAIPLHVRGGSILPMQTPATTTTKTRTSAIKLAVAPDQSGYASGFLFWDDGDSLDTYESKSYMQVNFLWKNSTLVSSVVNRHSSVDISLSDVTILNIPAGVKAVYLNGKPVEFQWNKFNILHFSCSISLSQEFEVQVK